MAELLSFLILISAGLFLSELFRKLHVPYVVSLIFAGILIGPYGFDIFTPNETTNFLGTIGLIFLMFMAGLEIRLSSIAKLRRGVARMAVLNGLIPFLIGFGIATYFGYDILGALLLGTIFISSSIAVVIPALESSGLLGTRLGKSIVAATVAEDVFSLILLSIVLQIVNPTTQIPLPLFYGIVFVALILLKTLISIVREVFLSATRNQKNIFEQELRFIFAILLGTVVFFEILGMHAIIAGFFAGLVLSESIKSELLRQKLHAISYGIFIPAFFIIIGTETDISVFSRTGGALLLTAAILIGSMGSKFISGWIGGLLSGFDKNESVLVGVSTIPQLSTTVAVAFVGLEFGLLNSELVTAMIALSIVSTFVGSMLIALLVKSRQASKQTA